MPCKDVAGHFDILWPPFQILTLPRSIPLQHSAQWLMWCPPVQQGRWSISLVASNGLTDMSFSNWWFGDLPTVTASRQERREHVVFSFVSWLDHVATRKVFNSSYCSHLWFSFKVDMAVHGTFWFHLNWVCDLGPCLAWSLASLRRGFYLLLVEL